MLSCSDKMETLPQSLKVRIASYLRPADAVRLSRASKTIFEDLALARIPMRIPFKSWYDDEPLASDRDSTTGQTIKRGPKIPFLPHRTHSVTLTGEWSCRLGELQGRQCGTNSQAQFYVVAYPLECDHPYESEHREITRKNKSLAYEVTTQAGGSIAPKGNNNEDEPSWLSEGGRIVWASKAIYQRHCQQSNSNSSWVKLSVTFAPRKDEEYFLCIQPGPGTSSQHHWWRHSLHMSNLFVHITYHDNPRTNFLLKRQFKMIVKHMLDVENRGAFYIKVLEAVARSIRIQLALFGRNALDPVLESFFQSTGIPRDTDSLLVLEEIARFLSYYAYVSERKKRYNNYNTERDSVKCGSSNRDSVPDWVPYAESSIANRSVSHHASDDQQREEVRANSSTAVAPSFPTVPEQDDRAKRRSAKRLQRAVRSLRKIPSSLWRAGKGKRSISRQGGGMSSWRADEMTEEFSISVGFPPEEGVSSAHL